jgi:hypothetical protein
LNSHSFFLIRLEILFLVLSITGLVLNSLTTAGLSIQTTTSTQGALDRPAQAETPTNSWRGIVPLRSTRVDVEKLLGKPISSRYATFVYDSDEERIDILYSAGKCVLSGSERWNVPSDVVITIELRPKKSLLIQDLHLDPHKYRRVQESHPANWFVYRNTQEGVMIETILYANAELVDSISYFPTTKDNGLRCLASAASLYRERE